MESETWYFQVRAGSGQRMSSRILQVLGTQLIEPQEFHSRLFSEGLWVAFTLTTTQEHTRRIGLLLRRLPGVQSALWLRSPLETIMPSDELAFSLLSAQDSQADTDPRSSFWAEAPIVSVRLNNFGELVPGHGTEIRSRWTLHFFYFLFECPYEELSTLPGAAILNEPTPELWLGDVAEIFLGEAHDPFSRYGEFEISPRGEWLDLVIEHQPDGSIDRAPLASGFESAARIDADAKIWYAFFRIPCTSVGRARLKPGDRFRINFYRSQGQPPLELCWQPTRDQSFHVPALFGTLVLTVP